MVHYKGYCAKCNIKQLKQEIDKKIAYIKTDIEFNRDRLKRQEYNHINLNYTLNLLNGLKELYTELKTVI